MADLDKVTLDIPEDGEVASRPESSVEKKPETGPMVSFSQLFRFYDKGEMAMLAVGVFFCAVAGIAFPCINIAFGELLDSTASLSNVEETTKRAVLFMIGVALCSERPSSPGWDSSRGQPREAPTTSVARTSRR